MTAAPTTAELEAIVERLPPDILRRLVFALGGAPVKITARNAQKETITMAVHLTEPSDPKVMAMRERIADHLADYDRPQLRKQIAKDMGVDRSGWFGKAIASMVRDGTLIQDSDKAVMLAERGRDLVSPAKPKTAK